MPVRFDAGARRAIVAATIEAEKHARSRPNLADLLAGLMSLPESPVQSAVAGLDANARGRIATAMIGPNGEADRPSSSPQEAERVLRQAAAIAGARGPDAEVGILDILAAALGSASGTDAAGAGLEPLQITPPRDAGADSGAARILPAVMTRAGIGYDSHRFGDAGPLILGGVRIEESVRLVGHSDGDAIAHAITDAVLGAAGAGDIGEMFSDQDPANRGRDSLEMLQAATRRVALLGYVIHHVDATVVAERPKISRYRDAMKSALAAAMGISAECISVKGKTNEGMGWVGRGEGIACIAVATLATSPTS